MWRASAVPPAVASWVRAPPRLRSRTSADLAMAVSSVLWLARSETSVWCDRSGGTLRAGGDHMPTWLLVLLIVLLVLAVFGGFGYSRR